MTRGVLGRPVKRREDRRLVSGRGRFVDDIAPAETFVCAFVRSPFAHAEVRTLDVSAALELPGVVDVLVGADFDVGVETVAFLPGQLTPRQPALARSRVRYAGEPVAAVLAKTRDAAQDALELVEVDYAPLQAVMDPEEALADDSLLVHPELGTNRC